MKSELIEKSQKEEEEELTFPCLREHKLAGFIVLFHSNNEGTCVYPCGGDYSNEWISAHDLSHWKTPEKSVLLTA